MKYIDTRELGEVLADSFEHISSQVDEAMPQGSTLLATFPERVVYERDGAIHTRAWTKGDDGVTFGDEVGAGVSTHDGSSLGILVGRSVLEAVDAVWAGDPVNLSVLVPLVVPDEAYFASDYVELGEAVTDAREWSVWYLENRALVRKACHGRLGATEAKVPSRRFSKMKGDLASCASQMAEAVDTICSLARKTVEALELTDANSKDFKESLIIDAQGIVEALEGLQETCGPVHMKSFATILDRSCDRMRDLLVMAEYISIDD